MRTAQGSDRGPFAIFHAVKPVRIGGVPAIAAAVNATRQTGGVTLLSCESQKIIRCALSNIPVTNARGRVALLLPAAAFPGASLTKARTGSPPNKSTTALDVRRQVRRLQRI